MWLLIDVSTKEDFDARQDVGDMTESAVSVPASNEENLGGLDSWEDFADVDEVKWRYSVLSVSKHSCDNCR